MTGANTVQGEAQVLRGTRRRLVAWSSGLTLLVVAVLGLALYVAVQTSLRTAAVTQLRDRAGAFADALESVPGPIPAGSRIRVVGTDGDGEQAALGGPGFGGAASGTIALILSREGEPVVPVDGALSGLVDRESVAAAIADGEDLREGTAAGIPVRVFTIVLDREDEAVLQIVQDRTAEEQTLVTLVAVMSVGGGLALVLSLVVGLAYSSRALEPIRHSLQRQRQFAADASHELRTPLAVIEGNVAQLLRHPERTVGQATDVLGDVREEVRDLTTLVDDLLLLARADSGALELRDERFDLADAAAEAMSRFGPTAASRGVTLKLSASPTPVRGDQDRIAQLVGILVDNAIRHSPVGSTVTTEVALDGSTGSLHVEDSGPGIRDEDLPRVFDRFWRARDAPSGGVGLGLAIAAWIADQHGGTIDARNRESGGARFTVRLPAA